MRRQIFMRNCGNHARVLALVAVIAFTVSCDSSQMPANDSIVAAELSAASTTGALSPKIASRCPGTGLWAVCSIENRLRQSGFVAQRIDSAGKARDGFSVKPLAYTLGRARLEIYLYKDVAALRREIVAIDTLRVAPVFIRSENLVALLYSDDATQAERLSLAITAGAPQPGPSR